MKLSGKIIRTDTILYPGRYWFVVSARMHEDDMYVMEVIRLRKCDYALFRDGKHKFIQVRPEEITIMDDDDASYMCAVYNSDKTRP